MSIHKDKERSVRIWHPIEDIRSLAENMSRTLDSVPRGGDGRRRPVGWRAPEPKLTLAETNDGFVVTAELPHVAKKDLHVNVCENSVTIFAHWSKEAKAKEKDGTHRVRREEQHYSRVVQLPAPVTPDRARATFRDRVLKIAVPRAAPSQVRRIEVK